MSCVLALENNIIDLNTLGDEVPDIRYSVLDCGSEPSREGDVDFYFNRLLYIEEFVSPAVVCMIGGHKNILPLSWNILVGDESYGDLELVPVHSLNAKEVDTFVYNPIKGFRFNFEPVRLLKVLPEYNWIFPKSKNGQLLSYPVYTNNGNPECIFITPSTSKIPGIISVGDMYE